jgi:hypothetical protein
MPECRRISSSISERTKSRKWNQFHSIFFSRFVSSGTEERH